MRTEEDVQKTHPLSQGHRAHNPLDQTSELFIARPPHFSFRLLRRLIKSVPRYGAAPRW